MQSLTERLKDMVHPLGSRVRFPHNGKMKFGKVVRFDKGEPHGSPFYVIDHGDVTSMKVPAHKAERLYENSDGVSSDEVKKAKKGTPEYQAERDKYRHAALAASRKAATLAFAKRKGIIHEAGPGFERATKTDVHYTGTINGKTWVVPHAFHHNEGTTPMRHAIVVSPTHVQHNNPTLKPEEIARVHQHIKDIHGGQEPTKLEEGTMKATRKSLINFLEEQLSWHVTDHLGHTHEVTAKDELEAKKKVVSVGGVHKDGIPMSQWGKVKIQPAPFKKKNLEEMELKGINVTASRYHPGKTRVTDHEHRMRDKQPRTSEKTSVKNFLKAINKIKGKKQEHKTGDGKKHDSFEAAKRHADSVHKKTGNIISVEKIAESTKGLKQIDELSKPTLKSYIQKAAPSLGYHAYVSASDQRRGENAKPSARPFFLNQAKKNLDKSEKREVGIARAAGKLEENMQLIEGELWDAAKDSFYGAIHKGLKDSIHPQFHKHYDIHSIRSLKDLRGTLKKAKTAGHLKEEIEQEEIEQIDELSKGTLGKYLQAAPDSLSHHSRTAGELTAKKKRTPYDDHRLKQAQLGSFNRTKGLSRASSQLTKEETMSTKQTVKNVLAEMMTRKHFRQVADIIKAHPDAAKRREMASHHAEIFSKQNPRFDHKRFFAAANAGEPKV